MSWDKLLTQTNNKDKTLNKKHDSLKTDVDFRWLWSQTVWAKEKAFS